MPPVSRVLIKYVILFYFMFYEINVCFLEYVNVIISIVIFSEGRSRLSYYNIFKLINLQPLSVCLVSIMDKSKLIVNI
jgi:hypothetical protein